MIGFAVFNPLQLGTRCIGRANHLPFLLLRRYSGIKFMQQWMIWACHRPALPRLQLEPIFGKYMIQISEHYNIRQSADFAHF